MSDRKWSVEPPAGVVVDANKFLAINPTGVSNQLIPANIAKAYFQTPWLGTITANGEALQELGSVTFDDVDTGITQSGLNLLYDVATGGAHDLRIDDNIEFSYSNFQADFFGNNLVNAILTSTVTGISGITGLGIQVETLDMGANIIDNATAVNVDTVNLNDTLLFPDGSTQFQAAIPDAISGAVETAIFHASFDTSAQGTAPFSVSFNPSGLKMFVLDNSTDNLDEYNLSVPFDVTTSVFSQFLDVSPQDGFTNDFRFRPDGTKLYTVGSQNDNVYEYDVSTPYDVSTAVFLQSFDVSGQDGAPNGVSFRPDGKKMYVVGAANDSIFEYDLTIPWDITTSVFLQSFDLSNEDNTPLHVHFRPDGTKMYMVGAQNKRIYDYQLSTPWNVTTARFDESLDVGIQDSDPKGMFLTTNNSKLYMVGNTNNKIYEYDLGIRVTEGKSIFSSIESNNIHALDAYVYADNSTQSRGAIPANHFGFLETTFFNKSLDVTAQSTEPRGITFNGSGLKMYVLGVDNLRIYEYDLTTPYRIAGATLLQSLDISGIDTGPRALHLNPAGKILFMGGFQNNSVYRLDLSTADDITTAVLTQTFSISAQDSTISSMTVTEDGDHLYVSGAQNNDIYQYRLPISNSITDAIFESTFNFTDDANIQGIALSPNSTKMYVIGSTNANILQYDLTSPEDITTAVLEDTISITLQDTTPLGIHISPDLGTIHVTGRVNDSVYEYNFGVKTLGNSQFDNIMGENATMVGSYVFSDDSTQEQAALVDGISGSVDTALFLQSFSVASEDTSPRHLFFNPNGLKMYFCGFANNNVYEYDLSIPFDVTTAVFLQSFSVGAQDGTVTGLFFRSDGEKMYISGGNTDRIFEYDLSTSFDISTSVFLQSFSVTAQDNAPNGVFFRPDGLRMYMMGFLNGAVFEYILTAPWDISTSSFLQSFSVTTQDTQPIGMFFRSDGRRMYIAGNQNSSVYEYILNIPWEVSSSLFKESFDLSAQDANPLGIFFTSDYTKFYFIGDANNTIFEYNLGIKVDGNSIFDDITVRGGSPVVDPSNVISITKQSEWDALVVSGEITIAVDTTILVKTFISTADEIVVNSGINFSLLGGDIATAGILYTGGNTFITTDGFDVMRIFGFGFFSGAGTGTLFDVTNGGTFFRIQDMGIFDWAGLGAVSDSQVFEILNAGVFRTGSKLVLDNVVNIALDGGNFTNFITDTSTPLVQIKSSKLLDITATVTLTSSALKPNESFLQIDPAVGDDSTFVITDNSLQGSNQELFDETGTTGTFTAVADATVVATSITSVTDSGGVARFNFTVGPTVFVNQKIVNSGFVTSAYNGTFVITATGAGFFEVADIAFDIDESIGSFLSDSVTLTDTTTTLNDGDTLTIETDDTTDYDGGAIVYNQLTNSVQINRPFTVTQTGSWNTASLNETSARVDAQQNGRTADAMIEAEADFLDTSGTTVTINTVGVAEKIGVTTWISTHSQRSTITSSGVMIYNGKTDKDILVNFSASVERVTGTPTLGIGIGLFKNGVLISGFVYKRSFNAGIIDLATTRTVDMTTGDSMELVVINFDNSVNINVYQANVTWNQTA